MLGGFHDVLKPCNRRVANEREAAASTAMIAEAEPALRDLINACGVASTLDAREVRGRLIPIHDALTALLAERKEKV